VENPSYRVGEWSFVLFLLIPPRAPATIKMVILHPPIPPWRSNYHIAPSTSSHLRQTPWCTPILDSPDFVPILFHHRNPPPHLTGRYTFFSETLNTPRTFPIWESFYRPSRNADGDDYGETCALIELGRGLDGHPNRAQGGVAATILDEVAGVVGYMHKPPGKPIVTAYMNTNYRKSMPTPGLVLARAMLDGKRSVGRKIYVKAWIEDGMGGVFTEAEVLFIEVEPGKL
jgi:thioesterase superfamily protein 4